MTSLWVVGLLQCRKNCVSQRKVLKIYQSSLKNENSSAFLLHLFTLTVSSVFLAHDRDAQFLPNTSFYQSRRQVRKHCLDQLQTRFSGRSSRKCRLWAINHLLVRTLLGAHGHVIKAILHVADFVPEVISRHVCRTFRQIAGSDD